MKEVRAVNVILEARYAEEKTSSGRSKKKK